ncbi:(2Fe-2S)-binding protein [Undibacterium sp. Rencai35W]|uniref:(2Fe-2S)-binding protein n=1 Tax=Undibacterium sp. Rencai35W TaxID=3413046 RepID=UPI003BF4147D
MIVCVCNNVSEKKLRHAVASGLNTMADLRTHLDVGTCCGKCASCARSILRECQNASQSAHHAVMASVTPMTFQRQPATPHFQNNALAA